MCFITGDTKLKALFETEPNFAQHQRGDSVNFSFNRILQITDCVVLMRKDFFPCGIPQTNSSGSNLGTWGLGCVTTQRNHGNSSCN